MAACFTGTLQSPLSPVRCLHSDDRADLRRSGLSDGNIAAMGCFSVEASEVEKLTGVKAGSGGYVIPYAGILDQTGGPYLRIRLRTPCGDMRYVSGRGDDAEVYVPPGFDELPVGNLLVITEGEKKSAKAVEEGIPCIGIQGVWSGFAAGARAAEKSRGNPVSEETPPLPALLDIARHYSLVLVLGDSDLLNNPQARAGLETLAKSLSYRGVRAVVAYCPPAFELHHNGDRGTKKQGLDDWLVADRFHAARALPALAFAIEVNRDGISDTFNARMIAKQSREELAFSRGAWHTWNGSIWEIDNVGHRRRLASKVAAAYRSYAERLDGLVRKVTSPWGKRDSEWPEDLKSWMVPIRVAIKIANTAATKIENVRGMDPAFTLAQSFLQLPDDVWDRDPDLLGVRNGVVDLRSGELLAASPKYRITRTTGVNYDPDAICPLFDKFLAQMQPDQDIQRFLQTLIGYSATGHAREQKIYIFIGAGANGKGTFISVVMKALGNYSAKTHTGMLAQQSPDRPRNDLAALAGVRMVSMSETSTHLKLDEGNLKAITGGDLLSARFLNREFFQFLAIFTPILDTNNMPRLGETGTAMRRRVKIVPWDVTIPKHKRDEHLRERLLDELPGILAWIVRGATRYLEAGLREPQRVVDESRAVMASCDPVGRWLEECAVSDQQARTRSSDLYQNYRVWASREGEIAMPSLKDFAEKLKGRGWQTKKSNGVMVWLGIRIRDNRDRDAAVLTEGSPTLAIQAGRASQPHQIPAGEQKPLSVQMLMPGGGCIA